jgi:hypothetical protein
VRAHLPIEVDELSGDIAVPGRHDRIVAIEIDRNPFCGITLATRWTRFFCQVAPPSLLRSR